MLRITSVMLLAATLGGLPILTGCDRTVSKDETVKTNSDGTSSKDSTTVKQKADGTVVKEEEHSVNK